MIKLSKPYIDNREIDAIKAVMLSSNLVQGEKVKTFEYKFAREVKTKFAIAVNNGTSALHTALLSLNIGEGDEVITTPFTFVATANAILMTGAKPVFVDIDERTFNIDFNLIEKKINKKTRAILAVDLFGQPADYDEINKIAKKYKLNVIEDAAQSIGAKYHGIPAGCLSDVACFSLYATKNIMSGEGGIITTQNEDINLKARMIRNHGQKESERYTYNCLGYNYRMMDLQASIALEQLKKLSYINKRRREIAKIYDKELKGIKGLITPVIKQGNLSSYHQYTLRITNEFKESRDTLKSDMEKNGILTGVYYPIPLHFFKHLNLHNYKKGDFPIAEMIANEVLSIPIQPLLTSNEVLDVIKFLRNYA